MNQPQDWTLWHLRYLKKRSLREKKKNKLILITSHILSDLDELTTHIMYMQDGKMLFFKDISSLQEETGGVETW